MGATTPQAAREKIREGVTVALQKQKESPLPPYVIPGPYVMEVRFFHTDVVQAQKQADKTVLDPADTAIGL